MVIERNMDMVHLVRWFTEAKYGAFPLRYVKMPGGYLKVELSAFSKGLTNQRVFFMANLAKTV